MKRYHLIKEYPGSPGLGIIGYYDKNKLCTTYIDNNHKIYTTLNIKFENYPDNWQEIVDKEYEILSFKDKFSNLIVYLTNLKHLYQAKNRGMKVTLDFCLNNAKEYWDIHSIKRLSDGEVFTIGDKVISYGTIKTIKAINLPPNTIGDVGFVTSFDNPKYSDGYQYLFEDKVEKYIALKPLFTTEDGVDIFEGDKYSYVNYLNTPGYDVTAYKHHFVLKEGMKVFSTKEAAEEYILLNKPCLSINDINFLVTRRAHEEKLRNLVKSKL